MRIVASLLAGLCLLAGCGGGGGGSQLSAADYRAQLKALGKKADAAQARLTKGIRTGKPGGLADALSAFADDYEPLAKQVADLRPPNDARAANAELAAGLRAFAAAARGLAPKIEKAATLDAALALFQHSEAAAAAARQTEHALDALKRLGYSKRS